MAEPRRFVAGHLEDIVTMFQQRQWALRQEGSKLQNSNAAREKFAEARAWGDAVDLLRNTDLILDLGKVKF
jgi:hypothetical protein